MTDSMKFGPEWLRNMNNESTSVGMVAGGGGGGGGGYSAALVTSMTNDTAPIIMAQFRYGREEMLLLFNRCNVPPDPLKSCMQGLFIEKQLPINLTTMSEEETRMWNRGINSDAALRLAKPGLGPGTGMPGTRGAPGGRGGSVDRGRGRARGSYHYSRGLSYEDTDTANGFNPRGMRSYDRTQSQGNWSERNGGDPTEYTVTSPRKEFGARSLSDTNWRRQRGGGAEEDDTWRSSRTDKWGRGSSNSWRESDNNWDRSNNNHHPPTKKPWESEENNLPEWAMENPSESGGTFDASGAFHGGSTYSDEDDGEGHSRSEQVKNNTNSTSQPRPTSHSKKEPPNIPNGNASDTGSSTNSSLKQSQSATSLSSEHRPTNHPITTSASFSGVDMHTSHTSRGSKPSRREEAQSKPLGPPPHQPPPNVQRSAQGPQSAPAPPVVKPKAVTKTSQDEEIEQRLLDAEVVLVSRLMDEEEKDPPTAQSNTATPPTSAPGPGHSQSHPHSLNDSLWYYQDPQANVQGPFPSAEMADWFSSGYFKGTLLVRRACDERYSPLSELIKLWKGIPFLLDYYQVPPIKNNESAVPMIDEALLLQVQMQQQQHQQQQQQRLMIQRAQAIAKLSQSDHFNLTLEQQQVLAHQAQMEMSLQAGMMNPHNHTHNQQPHTNANVLAMIHQLAQYNQLPQTRPAPQVAMPVPSPAEPPPDPVQQLMQQIGLQTSAPRPNPSSSEPDPRSIEQFMNAFRQRQGNPHAMESVWGGTNTAPNFPAWSAPPGHSTLPQSLWADPVTKGIKTEQEVLEEQLRAEERKKEELRKQEELQRIKEEEERQRRLEEEEELERRREEDEEREREKERKRMQEEEERKKKEAAAAKKAEQDRLRKEEEKKRKEEEKRRKEEEKRKQEEEKKRAEEEKKRLEEERKKREEMTKRQNEALKRLQEQQQQQQARAAKPAPAPWTTPETAGASLADIQKTERKQQQQLREQQEMLKAYQEKHQQEQQQQLKNSKSLNLKWAEPAGKNQPARVKSLAEIQAEEHEHMAKQAEKEKAERIAAAKDVPTPAPGSIWASAPQSLNWSTASGGVWGTAPNAVSGSGGPRFWDEVNAKAAKPQPQAQPTATKSQAKTKAKKEEASVMKLFEKQLPKTSKNDDFYKWCTKTLAACNSSLDIPTFVDFLLAFESQKEVREYIYMYLGSTKEANEFASEFIERRSRLFSADQPLVRPDPPVTTHSNHFQEVKGKNKKVKKGKMTKVDSRILGFNVTAAPDRINVGDRDYGE